MSAGKRRVKSGRFISSCAEIRGEGRSRGELGPCLEALCGSENKLPPRETDSCRPAHHSDGKEMYGRHHRPMTAVISMTATNIELITYIMPV